MKINKIKNYYKSIYIFFIFFSLIIFFFSTSNANSKAYKIENIEVSKPFEMKFDKNKVIDEGFKKAFEELILLIVNSSDQIKISWLGNPNMALISISVALCWQLIAFCTVIYLANLKNIPRELEDAAYIDGANKIQKFRYLDWPLLAPALTINTVVILISTFKLYDRVLALTGGGPGRSTETIAMLIIRTAFNENRVGFASSMSLLLLIISGATTFIALIYLGKREVDN